ncbi:hypothetical protein FHR33_006549 [Nonomuraea dietziae]|uniref:Uncharacterized protein n=1 Tax=Nonomuraea dietziae TaxID=65515 RepID=A0A7W5YTH3_9ACTN|nr:hypothetical protein [Nonomuraea dietziae]
MHIRYGKRWSRPPWSPVAVRPSRELQQDFGRRRHVARFT